jgi:hypothetical protein
MLPDIAAYLAGEGLGTLGTDLFMGSMPDPPNACVALYEYAGRPPGFVHDSPQPAIRYPRLQVLVRDDDYAGAVSRARSVYTALCGLVNATLGATTYGRVAPLGEPFPLARDESERVVVACNYEVTTI